MPFVGPISFEALGNVAFTVVVKKKRRCLHKINPIFVRREVHTLEGLLVTPSNANAMSLDAQPVEFFRIEDSRTVYPGALSEEDLDAVPLQGKDGAPSNVTYLPSCDD